MGRVRRAVVKFSFDEDHRTNAMKCNDYKKRNKITATQTKKREADAKNYQKKKMATKEKTPSETS